MRTHFDLKSLLNMSFTLSEKFHKQTMLKQMYHKRSDPKLWPKIWKTVYFKGYVRLPIMQLPSPYLSKDKSFLNVLRNRSSTRIFSHNPISLKKISALLFYTAGLRTNQSLYNLHRFYPSAGARYPLETYIVSLNSEIAPGLYHYYLKSHSLEELIRFKRFDRSHYFNHPWISKAGIIIILTAVFKRTTVKYGNRGYRHIMVEAGQLGQNFYLVSSALNIGCCAVAGFVDKKLNRLLDIDGINESVVYVLIAGEHKNE